MSVLSKFYYKKHRKLIKCQDVKHNKILLVSCETINERFKEYCIKTTHNEVMDILKLIDEDKERFNEKWTTKRYDKNNNRRVYKKKNVDGFQRDKMNLILKNIEKYDDYELNDIFEKNNQKWVDWCNDIILYHCYNKMLNNVCIPVVENKEDVYNKALQKLKKDCIVKIP